MKYENHPYAEVWPSLTGTEFDNLVADIKANGQRLPIILYDGKLLDGRNRDRACDQLGIEPKYETFIGTNEQAKALVRSLNEHRRHSTMEQRLEAVEKLIKASPEKSNRVIAEQSGVSKDTIRTIRANTTTGEVSQLERTIGKDGKSRPSRTLTPEERAERDESIRQAHAAGQTYKEIVRSLNVSNNTIADAIRNDGNSTPHRKPIGKPTRMQRMMARSERLGPLPALTREQVDPEFKGTPMEWVDKYGHVQIETAEKRATSRFNDWVIEIGHLAKVAKKQPALPDVDLDWLRSPKDGDIKRMREALEILQPLIQRAVELLERATRGKGKASGHDESHDVWEVGA